MKPLNERIAEWRGWKLDDYHPHVWYSDETETVMRVKDFNPDHDIALWHGPDGLLAEITKRNLTNAFIDNLDINIYGTDDSWHSDIFNAIQATPQQLTTALISIIEEGE